MNHFDRRILLAKPRYRKDWYTRRREKKEAEARYKAERIHDLIAKDHISIANSLYVINRRHDDDN